MALVALDTAVASVKRDLKLKLPQCVRRVCVGEVEHQVRFELRLHLAG